MKISTERTAQETVHELKTWPEYYQKVKSGEKTFEVRKLDRFFNVGDTLILKEWSPVRWQENGGYSGDQVERKVTYVMNGGKWDIPEGICIMGITPLDATGWQAIAESNRDANEQACRSVWALREENEQLKKQLAAHQFKQSPSDAQNDLQAELQKQIQEPQSGYVQTEYLPQNQISNVAWQGHLVKLNAIHCTCPYCSKDFDIQPSLNTLIMRSNEMDAGQPSNVKEERL
jgi:hypothetical protein